jgi:quinol monooxygenase YgiN
VYGTIAKFRLKPATEDALVEHLYTFADLNVPGFISEHIYKMDNEPGVYYMTVLFESREAYNANAKSPQMHEFYTKTMEFVDGTFEWHDGQVIYPRA